MRLLFVSHLYPWPAVTGNPMRVYHLLTGLARRHEVTLVALTGEALLAERQRSGYDDPVRQACARVIEVSDSTCAFNAPRYGRRPADRAEFLRQRLRGLVTSPVPWKVWGWDSPALVATLRALRAAEDFDAVWVERSYLGHQVRAAGFRRTVVDLDDLATVADQRESAVAGRHPWWPLLAAELAKTYLYERSLPRRFGRVAVCKEADRRFFGVSARRVTVVPNGAEDAPAADPAAERLGEVLFTGLLTYAPNIEAALYFHGEVLPRLRALWPGVRFVIAGRLAPPQLRRLDNGTDCVVESPVPDMAPRFAAASVVVAPIRMGSGTRIKVLEALARGKAVVATSIGAEGLGVRSGDHLELADDPEAFARAVAALLQDPARRARLGAAGRAHVRTQLGWSRAVDAAEAALVAAATDHGARRARPGAAGVGSTAA